MNTVKKNTINVVIVDDYDLITDGVTELLRFEEGIEIVGKAANRSKLMHHLANKEVDLILMDIEIKDLERPNYKETGIDLTQEVKQLYPHLKVIMLTQHNKMGMLQVALNNGADGYLLKDNASKANLAKAIRRVFHDNEIIIDPKVERSAPPKVTLLSKREKEVICLLVNNKSPREIGELLSIRYDTVREYLKNIRAKLKVRSGIEIVNYAHNNNLCK